MAENVMKQAAVKQDELLSDAKGIAKTMLKKGKEEIEKRLPEYLSNNAPLGVAVCKELIEIIKESVKGKSERQKEFLAFCDKVIDSCVAALKDGKISEDERLMIQKRINDVFEKAEESNKTYQKHKRDVAIAGVGGLTVLGVVSIITSALSKPIKK